MTAMSATAAETVPRRGSVRIGIDTGGTFTDVVALDVATGELVTTKTPSTPANPADGFLAGVAKVLALIGRDGADVESVSHGTTVATNQLLEGKVGDLGFITTEGYEFLLEIARQCVPDGYGNSYFWVKPPRIVPAAPGAHRRRPAGLPGQRGAAVRRGAGGRGGPLVPRPGHRRRSASASCTPTPTPPTSCAMRDVLRREHPDAVVSISSEVLREYREYERAVTTLVDAAVKPRMASYVANITKRLDGGRRCTNGGVPFYVMKSNGGVLSADGGRAPADHHRAVRAGRRRARRGAGRAGGRLRPGADLRRRRHVHRRVGGAGRRADAHHRGHASASTPARSR